MIVRKAIIGLFLSPLIIGGAAFGQTTSTCTFAQGSFTANFGVVKGATVGRTQSVISLTCTSGTPYQLTLGAFAAQNGNVVSAYRNNSEVSAFGTISMTGSGSQQNFPVYLKLHRVPSGTSLSGEYVILDASQGYNQSANLTITF